MTVVTEEAIVTAVTVTVLTVVTIVTIVTIVRVTVTVTIIALSVCGGIFGVVYSIRIYIRSALPLAELY